MDIIDIHQHLYDPPEYLDELVEASRAHGIVKVCLSSCGAQYGQPGNDAVRRAFGRYPDAVLGLGYVRLGIDGPDLVDRLADEGFAAAKVINPKVNYNDKSLYPVYERLQARAMPILFHTGLVARLPTDGEFDTASDRMRPVYLDAVARAFPELRLIGAHLGVPWFEEACAVAKANPNVWFDLSGVAGRFSERPADYCARWLFFNEARPKLLFGVDARAGSIGDAVSACERLLDKWEAPEAERRAFFHVNAARVLGLGEGG